MPSQKEIEDAKELQKKMKAKDIFRTDHQRVPYNDQAVNLQANKLERREFKVFSDMYQYLPHFRKEVPKSDGECVTRLLNECQQSAANSTMVIIPLTFFSFCNRIAQQTLGRSGSFILSIASTSMLTIANITFFQEVYNQDKLERIYKICEQYQPQIKNQHNKDLIQFIKQNNYCQSVLQNDLIADQAFNIVQEYFGVSKLGYLSSSQQADFIDSIFKLKLSVDPQLQQLHLEGQQKLLQIQEQALKKTSQIQQQQ